MGLSGLFSCLRPSVDAAADLLSTSSFEPPPSSTGTHGSPDKRGKPLQAAAAPLRRRAPALLRRRQRQRRRARNPAPPSSASDASCGDASLPSAVAASTDDDGDDVQHPDSGDDDGAAAADDGPQRFAEALARPFHDECDAPLRLEGVPLPRGASASLSATGSLEADSLEFDFSALSGPSYDPPEAFGPPNPCGCDDDSGADATASLTLPPPPPPLGGGGGGSSSIFECSAALLAQPPPPPPVFTPTAAPRRSGVVSAPLAPPSAYAAAALPPPRRRPPPAPLSLDGWLDADAEADTDGAESCCSSSDDEGAGPQHDDAGECVVCWSAAAPLTAHCLLYTSPSPRD